MKSWFNPVIVVQLYSSGPTLAPFLAVFQKYEKPKFVQCLAFLSTGDILTGDSGGVLLVWTRSSTETPNSKGPRGEQEPVSTS